MSQTLPKGSREYVGVEITASGGVDLSDDVIELAVVDAADRSPAAPDWRTPDLREAVSVSVVRVSLLVGPGGTVQPAVGRWRIWARVVDSPEIPWVPSAATFAIL